MEEIKCKKHLRKLKYVDFATAHSHERFLCVICVKNKQNIEKIIPIKNLDFDNINP